jgi:hypothetical protein
MNQPDKEILEEMLEEGKNLLRFDDYELYTILGGQLLGTLPPTRTARFIKDLSEAKENLSKVTVEELPSESLLPKIDSDLATLIYDLVEVGKGYFEKNKELLREALCTKEGKCKEEILKTVNVGTEALLKYITPIIAATLGFVATLYPIAVTITVIIIKIRLEAFCSQQ